jgi:hypothetical protein
MIWPAQAVQAQGHDITVIPFVDGKQPRFRLFRDHLGRIGDGLGIPPDADVMVFQRVCELELVHVMRLAQHKGIAVVLDIDDDLSAIAPGNPAFAALHPTRRQVGRDVSWQHLHGAAHFADLVTVTTPALVPRYAPHGRVRVVPNFLADHYYGHRRVDSDEVVWPAAYFAHPDDPQVVRGAVAQLVADGARFSLLGDAEGAGAAFGLGEDPPGVGHVSLDRWPAALARIGIGICPLADTRFNAAKSWLKPLELSAAGVPWVASPRVEYARLHGLGAGLVADKPKVWRRQLQALRTSPALRAELSEAGRLVADQLRLRDHAGLWWEAWVAARELADRRGARATA